MLLYIILLQTFLRQLEDALPGVNYPDFEERVEAYVDDVVTVGEDERDLHIINAVCTQFEAVSGAILNRFHKTAWGLVTCWTPKCEDRYMWQVGLTVR